MQLVLSGSRIIAHGENFIAMGGTVINTETCKTYQNATIVECDGCPADIGSVGYEYHAGVFVPCAPYGKDNGNGTILVACEECGTPKDSGLRVDEIIGAKLKVTAPAECEVVCSCGDKTVKGVYKNGVFVCNLTDYGTWTVTASRWRGTIKETASSTLAVNVAQLYTMGFGTTINVTYPSGSTVTCSNGTITLTAPDTTGTCSFNVLALGKWTVKSVKDSQSASSTVAVAVGSTTKSVTLTYFAATIKVTYPAKSTCTCKNGSTTLTDTNTGTGTKTATFTVPNTGTWTITATATDGSGKTESTTVSITSDGQSKSVELSYGVLLFSAGNEYTDVTGGWTASGYTMSSGYPVVAGTNTGSLLKFYGVAEKMTLLGTNKSISFAGRTKLQIQANIVSTHESYPCLIVMVCSAKTGVTTSGATVIAQSSGTGSKTLTIDVSSVSSGYVVMFVSGAANYKAEVTEVKMI